MPHKRRLRWTDWLGLVGLALLLVWTPGYVAQDPNERALTGGETFTLPMPRDGDRAVLDLVVTHGDGTVERYPAVMEIIIDAAPIPNQDLVGIRAEYRIQIVHHAANITWPGGQLFGAEQSMSEWFDAQGFRVWSTYGTAAPAPDGRDRSGGGSAWACERVSHLNDYAGQTFHYEPNTLSAVWRDLRAGLADGLQGDGCGREGGGGYLHVVNRAYDSDTGLLFGRHQVRSDRLYNQITQDENARFSMCPISAGSSVFESYYGSKYFGSHERFSFGTEDRITFTHATESRCDYRDHFERWDWLTPEFPYPVGQHARHHDANGDLLIQIDLLPSRIERGEGPSLPVAQRPEYGPHLLEPPTSDPVPMQTLAELGSDETPLLHGLTLTELDRRVRSDATDDLAAFLNAGAVLMAWGGRSDEINGTAENDASRWHLTYAQPDGERRTVTILLQRIPVDPAVPSDVLDELPPLLTAARAPAESAWQHQTYDACQSDTAPTAGFPVHCDDVDPSLSDPERSITDLAWLIPKLDAYSQSSYGSLTAPVYPNTASIGFDPWAIRHLQTETGSQAHVNPTLEWELRHQPADEDPRIFWAGGHQDMATGAAYGLGYTYRDARGAEAEPYVPASAATQTRNPLVALDPLETTLAFSGFVLAIVALVGRLWTATKSGSIAAFAAGFYAKIRKEDVLLHDRRDRIIDALRADPGLTAKELAAVLDAGWGATVHHLETLQRSGLVARVVVGRNRHHFLAKETTPQERRLIALRRDPAYAAFLDAVVSQPGRSLDEIAAAVPRGLSGLSRTGSRLARDGVLEKRKEGRTVRFYPVPVGAIGDHNR